MRALSPGSRGQEGGRWHNMVLPAKGFGTPVAENLPVKVIEEDDIQCGISRPDFRELIFVYCIMFHVSRRPRG